MLGIWFTLVYLHRGVQFTLQIKLTSKGKSYPLSTEYMLILKILFFLTKCYFQITRMELKALWKQFNLRNKMKKYVQYLDYNK